MTEWPSEEHSYSVATLPVEDVSEDRDSPVDNEYDWGSEEEDEDADSVSDTSEDESSDQADSAGEEKPTKRRRLQHPAPKRSSRLKGLKVKLSTPVKRRYLATADDEDEQKKIVEGADALLNLAGITTSSIVPMRSISPSSSNTNNNNNEIKVEKMDDKDEQS